MEREEVARWVLSVDRRALVMREVHWGEVLKPAEIAERLGRSVQNINRAVHELEEEGLIECINPEKHTWKRYVLTTKGRAVLQELEAREALD